jgi:hypothetical protein
MKADEAGGPGDEITHGPGSVQRLRFESVHVAAAAASVNAEHADRYKLPPGAGRLRHSVIIDGVLPLSCALPSIPNNLGVFISSKLRHDRTDPYFRHPLVQGGS